VIYYKSNDKWINPLTRGEKLWYIKKAVRGEKKPLTGKEKSDRIRSCQPRG